MTATAWVRWTALSGAGLTAALIGATLIARDAVSRERLALAVLAVGPVLAVMTLAGAGVAPGL